MTDPNTFQRHGYAFALLRQLYLGSASAIAMPNDRRSRAEIPIENRTLQLPVLSKDETAPAIRGLGDGFVRGCTFLPRQRMELMQPPTLHLCDDDEKE